MLTGHQYWNLEAYQESQDLLGHYAQIEASQFVATDSGLVPTGALSGVEGTPLDFRQGKSIGGSINATAEAQSCGAGKSQKVKDPCIGVYKPRGCVGFDNCWIYDGRKHNTKPMLSVWNVNSGIRQVRGSLNSSLFD